MHHLDGGAVIEIDAVGELPCKSIVESIVKVVGRECGKQFAERVFLRSR